ncbi:MAG: homocysteine S-methyltransferase family protein [Pseudomonadota bacterium]
MNRYEKLLARMRGGECVMIDGATGTEAERRGVPQLEGAWNGGAALSHPDIVREIHTDYIALGAQIIISNTFGTSLHALRDAGVEGDFDNYNRRAVELACEARVQSGDDDILVAGGISYWSWTGNHPALDELRASVEQQAGVMRDAGADLIMLEMMVDIRQMLPTLDSALTAGLPVWVGITTGRNDAGEICMRDGDSISDALAEIASRDIDLISVMHTPSQYIDPSLDVLEKHWNGLVGIYPDSGTYDEANRMMFFNVMTPEGLSEYAKGWLQRDLALIGTCCGMGVDHIAALKATMES